MQLIKWTCFRSSAVMAIFQGAEIRSAVTEECLPNKNWCITRWKAGWSWAFSCLHAADPDLYFIQLNMVHLICVFVLFCQIERRPPWLPFATEPFIPFVSLMYLLFCSSMEADWMKLLFDSFPHLHSCMCVFVCVSVFFYESFYFSCRARS